MIQSGKYKQLHDRVRNHEASASHSICFTNWKLLMKRFVMLIYAKQLIQTDSIWLYFNKLFISISSARFICKSKFEQVSEKFENKFS